MYLSLLKRKIHGYLIFVQKGEISYIILYIFVYFDGTFRGLKVSHIWYFKSTFMRGILKCHSYGTLKVP